MKTKNYKLFKISTANRNNRKKLLKTQYFATLKHRIETKGQLEPITVTNDMLVINGETRLDACIQLGIPVEYKIVNMTEKEGLNFMLDTGVTTRKWTSLDIINFHAVSGKKQYIKLQEVLEKTGISISYVNSINLIANGTAIANGSEEFNYGLLQDFDKETLIDYILVIKQLLNNKLIRNKRVVVNCFLESIEKQGLEKTKETFRIITGRLASQREYVEKDSIPMRLTRASTSRGNKHKFEFSSDTLRR